MNRYHLLLIDDEEGVLNSLERVLRDEQYEIFKCQNADDAMQIISGHDIDLTICDYRLSDTDGISLLGRIGREKPGIIPILLTGNTDAQIAVEAVNKLALKGFITKPWDNDDLKRTVRNALERHKKKSLETILAKDLMSKFAITISKDAFLAEAADLMIRFKISGLPVLSLEGKIVGIVTATDLFRIMGETAGHPADRSNPKVCEVMTEKVCTIRMDCSLLDIIRVMCDKNIHTLPVVEGDQILGIIGRRDVLYHYYKLMHENAK